MSTSPARVTSRLIILVAKAMSVRTLVNSPLASGCRRSCWRMNWDSVREDTARLVRETGDVLGRAAGVDGLAKDGEGAGDERRVLIGQLTRARGVQLLDQKFEFILQRLADLAADVRRQAPQLALARAERLLAGLVEELLVGVARLALARLGHAQLLVDLALERRGEGAAVEDHVLELGGEVDLARAGPGEAVKQLRRQRRGAVLNGAAKPVFLARDLRAGLERLEVDLDLGDRAIGQRHAAVAGAGLDRDLA